MGTNERIAALWLALAFAAASPSQQRILCIGDSITEGFEDPVQLASYRLPLWTLLRAHDHVVDFVGTKRGVHPWESPSTPLYDQDHYGWNGFSSFMVVNQLTPTPPPVADLALIHLGTNDIAQQPATASGTLIASGTQIFLTQLITHLRAANSSIKIIVAQIPPLIVNGVSRTSQVSDMNTMIGGLANVDAVANMFSTWQPGFTNDGIHPNSTGEAFLAGQWYQAMLQCSCIWYPQFQGAAYWQYGRGCAAVDSDPLPKLDRAPTSGWPVLGTTFVAKIVDVPASMFAVGSAAFGSGVNAFPTQPMTNCFLLVDPASAVLVPLPTSSAAGVVTWTLTIPNNSSLIGVEEFWQGAVLHSTGSPAVSNGLIVRCGL